MPPLTLSTIGLVLAAALSVCNVLADVSRKKVVERHELIAATFWVRIFASLVCTIALLAYALSGSPPLIHPPAALVAGDIKDIPSLTVKITQSSDEVSKFISSQLTLSTNENQIAAGLNKIIKGKLIYEEARFSAVNLSSEAREILGKKPRGETLSYLNRLLLADAYPGEILKRHDVALFGRANIPVSPLSAFLVYLAIDVAMIAAAQLLLMSALKVSPMSVCIPFMAFSPLFLIFTGNIIIGEMPPKVKLLGVGLIVVGSLVMHRKLFATGWTAPIRAIFREKGSRYVLLVAFILAITVPIEKQLIFMSDPMTQGFSYCLGLVVFFGALAFVRRADLAIVMRKTPHWAILAGVLDAGALLLMYFTLSYLAAVIVISIKRAGIVLSILAGWLFFKERELTDKLIAASVMLGGVLIFYLPLNFQQALGVAGLILFGMVIALMATHTKSKASLAPAPVTPDKQ